MSDFLRGNSECCMSNVRDGAVSSAEKEGEIQIIIRQAETLIRTYYQSRDI